MTRMPLALGRQESGLLLSSNMGSGARGRATRQLDTVTSALPGLGNNIIRHAAAGPPVLRDKLRHNGFAATVERRDNDALFDYCYGPTGSGRAGTRIVGSSPDKPMLLISSSHANGYKAEGFSRQRVL